MDALASVSFRMMWCPVLMERPDGTRYALMLHYQIFEAPGFVQKRVMGGVEHPDGRMERWVDLEPALTFDPTNRRLQGGCTRAGQQDGGILPPRVESTAQQLSDPRL